MNKELGKMKVHFKDYSEKYDGEILKHLYQDVKQRLFSGQKDNPEIRTEAAVDEDVSFAGNLKHSRCSDWLDDINL